MEARVNDFAPRGTSTGLVVAYGLLLTFSLAIYFLGALSYLRIYYACVAMVLTVCAIIVMSRRSIPRDLVGWACAFGALYAYFAISSLWALDPPHTIFLAVTDLIFPGIWLATFVLVRLGGVSMAYVPFRIMPWAVALLYAFLLARYGMIRPVDVTTADSIGALGNAGALTLVACLPFVATRAIRGQPFGTIETALTLGLLLLSESRAGYVLGAVLLVMTVWAARPLGRAGALRVVFGACVALVACAALLLIGGAAGAVEATLERFLFLEGFTGSGDQTKVEIERVAMYVEGWNAWRENPWLGIGYENLGSYVEARRGFAVVSHNLLITLAAEAGLASVLIFGGIVVAFFRRTAKVRDLTVSIPTRDVAVASRIAMLGLLASSMVHPVHHLQMLFVVFGVGTAISGPLSLLSVDARSLRRLLLRRGNGAQAYSGG
jgi:O-antigen ligase